MPNNNSNKKDLLIAFIIGSVAGILLSVILTNLSKENKSIADNFSYFKILFFAFPFLCVAGLALAKYLGKFVPVIFQFAKFALVGGLNFLIDMAVLNFLVFLTNIATGPIQSGFKAISWTIALTNSFFWNKNWTFKKQEESKTSKEALQFALVSIVGFVINIIADTVAIFFITRLNLLPPKTIAQVAGMIAAMTSMLWNFLGYKFIVFKSETKMSETKLPIN